jgi:peptide/nickel transport system ATP-binding protein
MEDGEIMGLAGESGCGKSTLCNSLMLLEPPMKYVQGDVYLDGERLPIDNRQAMNRYRYKKISVIPQYAMNALNPTRKIGQMTREILKSRHIDAEAILPELKRRLDLVELSHDVLNMYPIELSGGMKQRMVMVLSTLLDPSLLIADEITSALDVASQKAVAEMLVEFRDRGIVKGLMVITHDISILYQIADSILIMYAGQMAEKASTQTIIHDPRHPYTQLLISSLPKVGVKYSDERLAGIPGTPPLLLNPPVGCRFRDRCPVVFDKCVEEPPFIEVDRGHSIACWRET